MMVLGKPIVRLGLPMEPAFPRAKSYSAGQAHCNVGKPNSKGVAGVQLLHNFRNSCSGILSHCTYNSHVQDMDVIDSQYCPPLPGLTCHVVFTMLGLPAVLSSPCWAHPLCCALLAGLTRGAVFTILGLPIVLSSPCWAHPPCCPHHAGLTCCAVLTILGLPTVLSSLFWAYPPCCLHHPGLTHGAVLPHTQCCCSTCTCQSQLLNPHH